MPHSKTRIAACLAAHGNLVSSFLEVTTNKLLIGFVRPKMRVGPAHPPRTKTHNPA
jgi:hypothetical protein